MPRPRSVFRDYEEAKDEATQKIIGRPGMTKNQLQKLSRQADMAMESLRSHFENKGSSHLQKPQDPPSS